MTKEPITFDKLPQAVSYLTEQVEKIYQLVETLQPQKLDHKHQLIDIDKASILIQKSKPTIYRLARTGLIPTYKRGKKLYFYEDELLKWIEAGKSKHPIKYPFSLLYFHCTFAFAILHELLTYFHYDTRTI